jgi:ABC-2 type transport system ATP-binding protein
MPPLILARDLSKKYGATIALDHVNFAVEAGRIVGLIGPNGAGKTSALRAILGLTRYEGELHVLGREPFGDRAALMTEACFIADVAVLPAWLRVDQAIDFVAGVHPRFRRDRAHALLAKTQITGKRRMRELSKGMKTLVHLALTMAIDAKLLVLDEPTLGLDILARRSFYDALVNDYMDATRTILITTHQVEEVENLLTDVLFIDKGRIVLDCSLEDIAARYAAVAVSENTLAEARAARPFYERPMLGKTVLYFERPDFDKLASFGEVLTPSVSDLFVAKLSWSVAQ